MNLYKFRLLFTIFLVFGYSFGAEELDFNTLEILAKKIDDDKKGYLTPGAVVTKGDEIGAKSTKDIDSMIRSISGAYTQVDESNGGISVNIRSQSGFGRVNTMIDGVTQTYFGSSSDQSAGVHSFATNIGTSAYGALIDQNFLVGLEVKKGTFSGGNFGTAGSVDFRTIGVDDIVRSGKNFGFLGKYSYGSNKIGPSYMGSFAGKYEFKNGFKFGTLFGYSGKKIEQNYKTGNGDEKQLINKDMLISHPKNTLFKTEFADEKNMVILSHRSYDNHLAKREISSNSYQLNYNFLHNDFINLNLITSYQKTDQDFDKGASLGWFVLDKEGMMESQNKAFSFDINNIAKFNILNNLYYEAKFGMSFLDNDYQRITNDKDWKTFTTEFGLIPEGRQKIYSYYLSSNFTNNKFSLDANLNLQKFKLSGQKGECSRDNYLCYPKEAGNLTLKDTNFNYSLLASLNLDTLFSPFLSYTKATRPLNVQEFFTSGAYDTNINTNLKPESAKTFQVGFNSFMHGFLADDDTFGLKIIYYKTDVDNYIFDRYLVLGGAFFARDNAKAKFEGFEVETSYDVGYFYTNLSYSYQKALKLPISDSQKIAGHLGMGGGVTQFSELPRSYATLDIGTRLFDKRLTFGSSIKYTGRAKRVDPRTDFNANPPYFSAEPKTENLPNIPTIIDLYAIYESNDNLRVKFEVQNLTDKNYMDALYTLNSNESQIGQNNITLFDNKARGRSFIASIVYKF
ncbi:TonB-dependent receptor plug domain-containing protein [Campylobacter ureolyticus]|uniref:TonB-dependent receptor plug domain-containing protein n=1 Tax=Campylobacter ureolyticus TaxID=827 RepID=UPI0022B5DEFF|nr:TonB-dependent receptor plug domain-containing protein [Campylobacter ureolyticus]MCZ6103388.1 TonB-dependent receptor [Campylobacter ureolyticus]MCZ6134588.1 TonB-dependent receptor [Campylobacter ureolyticus]MDU4981345.1 TonB-dependent receptor [Campylobacter ureolyticus]